MHVWERVGIDVTGKIAVGTRETVTNVERGGGAKYEWVITLHEGLSIGE